MSLRHTKPGAIQPPTTALEDLIDGYLYSRVSTKRQLYGLGIDRQDNALTAYLKHHPEIVLKGTFKDLGIAAYRGTNKLKGEWGQLLAKIKSGEIKRGSIIVCESLDRLSRDDIYEALPTFMEVMGAGLKIATVIDGHMYERTGDSMRDMMSLMYAMMVMSRAAEESNTKSDRGQKNWIAKRLAAIDTQKMMTPTIPAWLDVVDNKAVENDNNTRIVNRIFELCASGHGAASILHRLNDAKDRCFGWSGTWSTEYIRKILTNRAVLGEFQPSLCNYDTDKKPVPIGDPIPGYFPVVIDTDLWQRAQDAMQLRASVAPNIKERNGVLTNLFGSLCRCAACDGPMVVAAHHRNKAIHYLRCKNRYVLKTCEHGGNYRYEAIEAAILDSFSSAIHLPDACTEEDQGAIEAMAQAQDARAQAQKRLDRQYVLFEDGDDSPTLRSRIVASKAQIAAIDEQLAGLTKTQSLTKLTRSDAGTWTRLAELRLQQEAGDTDARAILASEMRKIVRGLRFFPEGAVVVGLRDGRQSECYTADGLMWTAWQNDAGQVTRRVQQASNVYTADEIDAMCGLLQAV